MLQKIYPNDLCPCGSRKKYKNCCGKVSLNGDDKMASFIECLDFLTTSINNYDRGNIAEHKRIAVELRKLLHNTNQSTSILSLLNKENIMFIDSIEGECQESDLYWVGLGELIIDVKQYTGEFIDAHCEAHLGNITTNATKDFQTWWEQDDVLMDNFKTMYKRNDIVLEIANRDDGAHVEGNLLRGYYETTRGNGIGMTIEIDGHKYNGNDVFAATIRQIAHEVIFSLYNENEFRYISFVYNYVRKYIDN